MVTQFQIPRRTRPKPAAEPLLETRTPGSTETLQRLRDAYQPSTEIEQQLVETAVQALLARVMAEGLSGKIADLQAFIEELIADIEDVLVAQLDEIAKDPTFLKLEGAWRGVFYHYEQTQGGDMRATLLPATRTERRNDLKKGKRGFLAKTFGQAEYEQDGGRPYTYLVVDDEFSHAPTDVDELDRWGQLGERYHFIVHASVAPQLFGVHKWTQLPDDTEKLQEQLGGIAYARWNKFVNDPNNNSAMFIGLSAPRVLARGLYDSAANPANGVEFFTQSVTTDDGLCWMNAAYVTAARFGVALRDHGFTLGTTGKRNGGAIDGLPMTPFPVDPAKSPRLPLETMLTDVQEFFLAEKVRLVPVCGQKSSTAATVYSMNSLQVPAATKDIEESRGAQLRGSLAVLAACCRISHHAKLLARELIGDEMDEDRVKEEMSDFLTSLSLNNHKTAERGERLRRPLRGFEVDVGEIEDRPGYYDVKMRLIFPSTAKVIAGTFHLRALPRKKPQ